jgi:NAD-dependent deacetylase
MVLIPDELRSRWVSANSVAVLTGAGISAEVGVPTFRDAQTGLWARWRPEDLATPQAFQRNPRLVWDWYLWRRELVRDAEPGAGHIALAEMERRIPRFHLSTQNVDGLHRRAGSRNVSELHGNLFRDLCAYEGTEVEPPVRSDEAPPRCPRCGGPVRPGVVWFGEPLPASSMREAQEAALGSDIYLVVGTSGLVHPAAELPGVARRAGAFVVEINPESTPLTDSVDLSLRGRAGDALSSLLECLP